MNTELILILIGIIGLLTIPKENWDSIKGKYKRFTTWLIFNILWSKEDRIRSVEI